MSNVMKIVIALIAVLVVCAAAYGIGSVAGLFGGGSSSQEEEEVRMADVPNLANLGLTEDQAREAAEKAGFKLEVSGTTRTKVLSSIRIRNMEKRLREEARSMLF